MKVMIVKELMTGDVSPVAMFAPQNGMIIFGGTFFALQNGMIIFGGTIFAPQNGMIIFGFLAFFGHLTRR